MSQQRGDETGGPAPDDDAGGAAPGDDGGGAAGGDDAGGAARGDDAGGAAGGGEAGRAADGEVRRTRATGAGGKRREPRTISDLHTLRALAHPTRIALLETLVIRGAMTATEASEHVNESPSSCSFHLRQLKKYGFVEEAGGGKGRARPWRMTELGLSFSTSQEDPATEIAATALYRLIRGRQLERYRIWQQTWSAYPPEWREAALDSQSLAWLTPEELKALGETLVAAVPGMYERIEDPSTRPPGALPVELLLLGHPIAPPSPRS